MAIVKNLPRVNYYLYSVFDEIFLHYSRFVLSSIFHILIFCSLPCFKNPHGHAVFLLPGQNSSFESLHKKSFPSRKIAIG